MGFNRMIPPKRTGVDLSHIRVRPDGSRYAEVSELMERQNVKDQLKPIEEARRKQEAKNKNKKHRAL